MEAYIFDVLRLVSADQKLGENFDLAFEKNEPILGRISFVFMEFQGLLELPREPMTVRAARRCRCVAE